MRDKMKVWKVTEKDGNGAPLCIDKMAVYDEICGGMESEEAGNKYLLEVVDMPPDEFYNLPEWDGF